MVKSFVLYPPPLTKKNKQTEKTQLIFTEPMPSMLPSPGCVFWKHELQTLESYVVTTLLPSPENRCWHVGHSPVVYKQCSRDLSVSLIFLFGFYLLMGSETLRHRLKILEHMSVLSHKTLGTSMAWLPRGDLILSMVTVLLAPDPGFDSKTWVEIPLVLLLNNCRAHVASYLTCDLVSPSIKWDNTC